MHAELSPEVVESYVLAGEIHKKIRHATIDHIKAGVKLLDIAVQVESEIVAQGATPAFPCNISINHIASHDTPSIGDERIFLDGDVVKLDFGVSVDGYVADAAFTVEIGARAHAKLISAAERALAAGISVAKPGAFIHDIGRSINESAMSEGYRTLKDLLGHSLKRNCLHGGITIPSYDDGSFLRVREGDVLAIEPFLTAGSGAIVRANRGNIYQLIRNEPIYAHGELQKGLLAQLSKNYQNFPFAERWLTDTEGVSDLVRSACLYNYPVLVEADLAPVAQAESTIIVEREGCRVIA
jgi:methionyl aminopeptidase